MPKVALLTLLAGSKPLLRAILDGARDPVLPPIRSEIFGVQRFAQHGRSLGETHRSAAACARAAPFYPRLAGNLRVLREAHAYIGLQASTGYDISPAAEWLLDNFHLIEAQLKAIHEGLPRGYFRRLPVLQAEPLAGLPRIYGVAWAFVAHTDGAFDEDLLRHYLCAYLESCELSLGELWALPTTLRVVLVENLRRLAERVATDKAAREVANLVCDRLGECRVEQLALLLAQLNQRGVGRVFLTQMAQRLPERRSASRSGGTAGVHEWLQAALPDRVAAMTEQPAHQAADNLSVSNAVNSLRAIGDADWPDIIARTSPLMRLMLTSALFEAEDVPTRDQTLQGVATLARRAGQSEVVVGRTLLDRMRAAQGEEAIASHWLRGAGRPVLERDLGMGGKRLLPYWYGLRRHVVFSAYLGTLLLLTWGLVWWALWRGQPGGSVAAGSYGLGILATALAVLPASQAVVAVVNRLISESVRPRHLPRLSFGQTIPLEHRVMVVVPAMLSGPLSATRLAHRLQLHYLANPEPQAQFALLTDWVDAATAQTASDAGLLDDARTQVALLNTRYPRTGEDPTAGPRFILLHRARSYSNTERCWIGWERKRGKLELLLGALAVGSHGAFLDLGALSVMASGTRYLVTLDSDTQLPPGRLRELVGIAAHPHNTPRLDATGRRVVGGYAILQPRVATPLPTPGEHTPYHWLFAGQCGTDPYSAASSEVYQDLFGEGTFTGKGLLHVQAAHTLLCGRLPIDQVLSHDLLEGSMARCAAVTDITVIEDAPYHADVAASRVHRWTRGDWQLLPFLLNPWRYPMRPVNRWKMFDNLRRSLVAPASLALLVLALAGVAGTPVAALLLVLASVGAGPLMGAVAGFSPSRDDVAKLRFYHQAVTELVRSGWGAVWHLAQLLQDALMALDAVARALLRMGVTRRHLLQWTTAEAAQVAASTDLWMLWRRHWVAPVVAGGLMAMVLPDAPNPAFAAVLCLVWAASPWWTWWVSRPPRFRAQDTLPLTDQVYLEGIARDAWRLFERCVGAQDNHLPPDNLQTMPHDMVAHRTSPTNLGLYLLSVACARQFGWIGTPELITRLRATLTTMGRLQRHGGHFLNWYDTESCAPLLPMYVSTVDSGNLSGHLLAVAQACRELAVGVPATDAGHDRVSLDTLAADCERLAWEPDFAFLYHRKRNLFHIGYRVAEQQLDASFYDLLASESRQTSLLAIAKGDVPVRHWAALGRPFFAVGSQAALRSWSGSMFEYLMPSLVLDEPRGSVLRDAGDCALREQVAFARRHGVPWGISESAYAGQDHTLAYQYAPQGVPRLALRRTPADELVVAPYATALAAQIAPHCASLNFAALQQLGARKDYGFIEALDFTAARQTDAGRSTPVCTFMAHHQGMSIVALANVLLGGVAQRWGMANPHIEAVSSLLHERPPREVSTLSAPSGSATLAALQQRAPGLLRDVLPGSSAVEPTHVLSNGRYSLSLRANGAGSSQHGKLGITRWRDDALRDAYGSFFYLRWDQQPQLVSITQHPAPDPLAQYRSTFHADRVCFDAAWPQLQALTTVWVSPEDDIEFRQVELHNHGARSLEIELISAFEVTLCPQAADESHPAFSNLFVSAQWLPQHQALVFARTPRLAGEDGLMAAHFLASGDEQVQGVRVNVDRSRWLGRNRGAQAPLGLFEALPEGADPVLQLPTGLDPVCAIAVRLRIARYGKAQLTFATAASSDSETLRAVIDKYRQPSHVQRASLMSATLTGIRLRAMAMGSETYAAVQSLSTALLLTLTRPADPLPEACDRRLLWRFGISGERALILVHANTPQGLGMLRSLAQALSLWSWGNVPCDLVVVNAEPASYAMALQRELIALRERHAGQVAAHDGPTDTSLVLLRADELTGADLSTLQALARVHIHADGRPLLHHVQEWIEAHDAALQTRHDTSTTPLAMAPAGMGAVPVAQGVFGEQGREFRFDTGASLRPPRPWVNVMANAVFGTQVSEAGGGYSWARNSRLMQLTGWSNDALCDPPSEWFLIQNRRSNEVWSVSPVAGCAQGLLYQVSHNQGSTTISHRQGELEVRATWCVDADRAVKQVRLVLRNHGNRTLHLRLVGIAEWIMGERRAARASVHTALLRQRLPSLPGEDGPQEQKLSALLCTQADPVAGFAGGTAFLAVAGAAADDDDWTCDRRELFDARGALVLPDHFGQGQGVGLDPCAAIGLRVRLAAAASTERVFLLGYADDPDAARQLATLAATAVALERERLALLRWDDLLGATQVLTPDPLFDALVNRWLLYQTVSCRMWAKAGFYQAGGATGFRDQLQDALALAWAAPAMLRQQIVLCASRQFAQGDVQHWWHAPLGAGVRTHFSDDLLWLPVACVHYLRATGDTALLDEEVPFIQGAEIPAGAEDAYYVPERSTEGASVYEHAARAIDRSLRVGVHGLPLMGSGDWNDGMNRVGIGGRGESVWLGWFLCWLVTDTLVLARSRGDQARVVRWEQSLAGWKTALLGPAWDGQWFKRAFFDGGEPLGGHANAEARIDLIAQAWAVLSGAAPEAMQRMALAAVQELLVDQDKRLVRLLDPPLQHAVPSAGYIQAYPPGVRENGGQYSHAAVWALMAQAAYAGQGVRRASAGDLVYRMFTWISPAHRAIDPVAGPVYGLEPYVVAGDVYSQPPYAGRGGWSWYTGAAAWLHRAAIESMFGLRHGAVELSFSPCLPPGWGRAELRLVRDGRSMHFILLRASADQALELAGQPGAALLQKGALLRWNDLAAHSCFVVPLIDHPASAGSRAV